MTFPSIYPGNVLGGSPTYHGLTLGDILYYTTPGADTFDKADYPGLRAIRVEVISGGGAGGGAPVSVAGSVSAGAGGSSGAYSRRFILATDLGDSETVTVGAGGVGVSGGNGGNGGSSSFTWSGGSVVANGGGGGNTLPVGVMSSPRVLLVGGSAAASGGDLNCDGNPASDVYQFTGGSILGGPDGAPSILGGGVPMRIEANGIDATTPGAGGGGMRNAGAQAAKTGGAGGPGIVIVELWY